MSQAGLYLRSLGGGARSTVVSGYQIKGIPTSLDSLMVTFLALSVGAGQQAE